MVEVTFGEWLKRQRKSAGLTQEQLALQISCSTSALRKFEAEERRPSAQVAERLAEIFEIPQDERRTFLRFARGDWQATPAETREDSPWRTTTRDPRSHLPTTVNTLIGREKEIAHVRGYLLQEDIRLVTLTGPPGIGKTRLSIEAARISLPDFPDGVFFVALASLEDPDLIAITVAQALGYVETGNISTDQQLKESIGDKKILIVLDNCEHLIEGTALLTSQLLSACSRLKILATSRESLRIPGEWLYPIPALDVPGEHLSVNIEAASSFPALTLFAERARAVRPDFVLTAENIRTVASLCAQLDGLPLAIELIAARVRLTSLQALLERLNDQLILSADGMRAVSTRQKTLNDAIHWSYNLLSVEEQSFFTYLSVFSGGFTLEVAEAILSQKVAHKPISDLTKSLLDKSLLQYEAARYGEGSEPRYTMLVTIQNFARTRLRQMGEETELRNQHLAYFLDLAQQADQELRGQDQLHWLHCLEVMRDNLRAALDWAIKTGQTEAALQMARKLHWFWFVRGDHNEGRHWLERVLALPEGPLYPAAYAEALSQIAHHTWLQIGAKEARPLVEQALSVARAHNDKWNIAKALGILGLVLVSEQKFEAAQSIFEESQILFRKVNDQWGYAQKFMGLGLQAYKQDNREKSLALHEQALVLFRQLGDRYFQSAAFRFIGNLLVKQDDWRRGIAALCEALILAQDLNSKWETYAVLWSLGEAEQRAGNHARAVQLYCAAKNIADSIGAWQQEDEVEFENNLATCHATLSEKAFATSLEEGRAMTIEQAVTYALEKSGG